MHLCLRGDCSEHQKALRQYQRELIANAKLASSAAASPVFATNAAPRLDPLGSPGPVTPLALEEEGGYLAAGAGSISNGGSPVMSGDEGAPDSSTSSSERRTRDGEKMSKGSRDSKGSPVFVTSGGESIERRNHGSNSKFRA